MRNIKAGNELWYSMPLWAKLLVAAGVLLVGLVAIKLFPTMIQTTY